MDEFLKNIVYVLAILKDFYLIFFNIVRIIELSIKVIKFLKI